MTHVMRDGKWHNYSCSFNGKSSKIYLDGKEISGKNKNFTVEFWMNGDGKSCMTDEIRTSACARRKKR